MGENWLVIAVEPTDWLAGYFVELYFVSGVEDKMEKK